MARKRVLAAVGCSLVLAGAVWARKPGDPLKPGFNVFSRAQDIQLGQVSAAQVRGRYAEVQDEFLQAYLRRIGDRLAETPEARQGAFPFSFTLLNVPMINAFALPGGPMFVFTGLIKATDNEAQLAAAMAHEMSHVILRHGTHEASKKKATGWVAMIGGALAGAAMGNASAGGQLANAGLGLGENSLLLHFSRDAETEADALGSHLMAEAGYDPIEMAHFFEKLAQTGSAGSQFFSDHPNPENRERAIEAEIRTLPARQYGYETGDFARAKAEINMLPPVGRGNPTPSAPLPPGVAPSGTWLQTSSNRFRVAFPANWKGYRSADGSVTIAPDGGLVKLPGGGIDMMMGVTCNYYRAESAQMSLGTATLSLVAHLHEIDPSLILVSTEQKRVNVDGSEGLVSPLQSKSYSGGRALNVLLTVGRPEGTFYALATAPEKEFLQLQNVFNQILNTIRFVAPTSGTPENRQSK